MNLFSNKRPWWHVSDSRSQCGSKIWTHNDPSLSLWWLSLAMWVLRNAPWVVCCDQYVTRNGPVDVPLVSVGRPGDSGVWVTQLCHSLKGRYLKTDSPNSTDKPCDNSNFFQLLHVGCSTLSCLVVKWTEAISFSVFMRFQFSLYKEWFYN